MKLNQYAISALLVAMPMFAVERVTSVAEGTVRKIDSSAKTIVVATKDGAEHTFRALQAATPLAAQHRA